MEFLSRENRRFFRITIKKGGEIFDPAQAKLTGGESKGIFFGLYTQDQVQQLLR